MPGNIKPHQLINSTSRNSYYTQTLLYKIGNNKKKRKKLMTMLRVTRHMINFALYIDEIMKIQYIFQ